MCARRFFNQFFSNDSNGKKTRVGELVLHAQCRLANVFKAVAVARQIGRPATVVTVNVYPFGEKTSRQMQITCSTDKLRDVVLDEITQQARKAGSILTDITKGGDV